MKSLVLLMLAAASSAGAASPKVTLDQLAPRPPAPPATAPGPGDDQPKGDGLNPMLKSKKVPRTGKRRKTDVRVRGAAVSGGGVGDVRGKVGEF